MPIEWANAEAVKLGEETGRVDFSDVAPSDQGEPPIAAVLGRIGRRLAHAPRDASRKLRKSWKRHFGNQPSLPRFMEAEYGRDAARRTTTHLKQYSLRDGADHREPLNLTQQTAALSRLKRLNTASSKPKKIDVSIIVPVYNHLKLTLSCLESLLSHTTRYDIEIIVANDTSNDTTGQLLSGMGWPIRCIRNLGRRGFLTNCNFAAAQACGEFLVFLNNDTVVLPNWLDALIDTLRSDDTIGLVGSRLIFPDGRLQESGGIVFADGSTLNYGRGDDPRKPAYCYPRDVDYVSGASIAIPTLLWRRWGGFDEQFSPAYYEDTDLAFRVRQSGFRVVYQNKSSVMHLESISYGKSKQKDRCLLINRAKFFEKWKSTLTSHQPPPERCAQKTRSPRKRMFALLGCCPKDAA